MKTTLGLKYRRLKPVKETHNHPLVLTERKNASEIMISLIRDGRVLVNIDETVISQTTFHSKVWSSGKEGFAPKENRWRDSLKLIAAIDTEGRLFYSVSENNSNMQMFSTFLRQLVSHYERLLPGA